MCSLSVPRDRVVMEVSMCVRAQEFRKLRGIFGEILLLLCHHCPDLIHIEKGLPLGKSLSVFFS